MSETMIERVAKSIFFLGSEHDDEMWEHMQPHLRKLATVQARAAIEAMHEPTKEMCLAGFENASFTNRGIWRSMISAALQPATDSEAAK